MSATLKATTVMMSEEQRSFVSRFMEEGIFSHFNSDRYFVFPGFCDVHVHFR